MKVMIYGGRVFLMLCLVLTIGCKKHVTNTKNDAQVPELRLCLTLQPTSCLVILAHELGMFAGEGLKVTVKEYVSGKPALEAMLNNEGDITTTAEVPFVFKSFFHEDLKVLCKTGYADNMPKIIARKDRGITRVSDLRNKKIATQKGSAVHFFLYVFLLNTMISEDEIIPVYMKAEELPDALIKGEIDAFSMREPYISMAKKKLGDNAVIFSRKGIYRMMDILVTSKNVVLEKPEALRKFIGALCKTEIFIRDNEERAITLLAKRIGASVEEIQLLWPDLYFYVSLDQELIMEMESKARWIMNSEFFDGGVMPDYLDFVVPEILIDTNPERNMIIY